jgi:hypothetical protein
MTLVHAVLASLVIAYRLRARVPTTLEGDMDVAIDDPGREYSDEELCSWGFGSREKFRAAEVRHFEESAHEGRGVSEDEWRRYHGLSPQPSSTKIRGTRTRPLMRQRSRSRRATRRARVSRRARPASRAAADPEPGPGQAPSELLHEGGRL